MKLYETEPGTITLDGRKYPCKAPFDTVLFVLDVLRSGGLLTADREQLAFRLLFGRRLMSQKKKRLLLEALLNDLHGEPKAPSGTPPCMSFSQDADLIRAAFLQQYGIDLDQQRGRMSWKRFSALLSALTEQTEFVQVVQLRARPLPEPNQHNQKERMALIAAKQRIALRPETGSGKDQLAVQLNAMFNMLKQKAGEPE